MIQPIVVRSTDGEKEDFDSMVAHVALPMHHTVDLQEEDGKITVQAFHYRDSVPHDISIDVNIIKTLQEMGLSQSIGCLKLLLDNNGEWIPLVAQLGMPLFPVPLCQSVCEQLSGSEFLSKEACEMQQKRDTILQDVLNNSASQHIGHQTADFVPTHALRIDSHGEIHHIVSI